MKKSPHYLARKKALKAKGIKLVEIAAELGVKPTNVTRSIQAHPRGRNTRIEQRVARYIGKPLHIVYPEFYRPGKGRSRQR